MSILRKKDWLSKSKVLYLLWSTIIKGEVADAITEASNPWNYGSNSFKSNLEEIMRDTIINYVDSKFSDLDWKLSSIESKLNCM